MVAARGHLDRMMDEFLNVSSSWETEGNNIFRLALDVSETDEVFTVSAAVPGVQPDELEISFADNTLVIKGESKQQSERENERFHLRERRFGQFMRSITLPVPVNGDAIDAHFESGVLTLTLPKAEEVKPRRIAIRSNGNTINN
jgi:HSP20 family protein